MVLGLSSSVCNCNTGGGIVCRLVQCVPSIFTKNCCKRGKLLLEKITKLYDGCSHELHKNYPILVVHNIKGKHTNILALYKSLDKQTFLLNIP